MLQVKFGLMFTATRKFYRLLNKGFNKASRLNSGIQRSEGLYTSTSKSVHFLSCFLYCLQLYTDLLPTKNRILMKFIIRNPPPVLPVSVLDFSISETQTCSSFSTNFAVCEKVVFIWNGVSSILFI